LITIIKISAKNHIYNTSHISISVPNKIESNSLHFQFNSTHKRSCILFKAAQDQYVDVDQHIFMSIIKPYDFDIHLMQPSMEIVIESTNGQFCMYITFFHILILSPLVIIVTEL